ncbi:MAG: type IX secretion system protein PorQ [Bacteroidia bacterium]|nr:type IX secretion system protein PorQ [Bacteroidia bacterium]MCX7652144.1 type IX secretion system protein PorQ [Bacteroidia bacterium]MDW8416907.1 type IX secretion system protein PorQ [Bacteroidia bacterium]
MQRWWFSGIIGLLWGQIAGGWSYDFLNLPPSARSAALGGLAWGGANDLNASAQNPAFLRPAYHHSFHLTVQPYLADIFMSQIAYAHHQPSIGTFWAGLLYINYGQFRQTDELGNALGNFYAYEGALMMGASRHFGRWHTGMNIKFPFSVLSVDRHQRLGLGADIGMAYEDSARGLSASLVVRNLGTELYRPSGRPFAQPFPTSLQMTLSYRVPHAPFRIHVGAIHLERWKMAYNDPLQPIRYDLSGNPVPPPPPKWTEHLFRHFVGGVELLPEGFVRFRMAYHVQRRRELNPVGSSALGGMSFGAGIYARKWQIDYAYALFFRRAAAHTISLAVKPFRE